MAFATWYDLDQKFSVLKVFQRPHAYFDYGIQGGSFDLRTYTLDQFYHKHLLGWNTWSRSNEGYDLARYMGTKWTFYPHPHIPYLVFWERNWDTTEFEQLPKMHPFWLLVHRRNTFMVLPRSMRGRKRKIWIRPPSLQSSRWYFASSWVSAALFRIGVTPVNIEAPFVHKASGTTQPFYAAWAGFGGAPTQNQKDPLPVRWTHSSFNISGVPIMYRWWWDNGEDNYILINRTGANPGNTGNNMLQPLKINYPYYVFFYGAMLPQGNQTIKAGTEIPGKTPVYLGMQNPTPIGFWWFYDRAVNWSPDTQTYHMDTRYLRPEDLPTGLTNRTWVYFYNKTPFGTGVAFNSDDSMKQDWTDREVGPRIQAIVENSPFVLGRHDIPFGNREINILGKYTSVWQWGGTIPKPDTVVDPESIRDLPKPTMAAVRNPANVGVAALHPWDLTQGGLINNDKFREILTSIFTPPGPARPHASRPATPSPRREHRPRYRRRRKRRAPTPSESEESDEPQSSSRSSGRAWARSPSPASSSQSPSRSENSSTETEEEEDAPPAKVQRRQFLQFRPLLR